MMYLFDKTIGRVHAEWSMVPTPTGWLERWVRSITWSQGPRLRA